MATSGSINYLATRDDIITEALEQLGVLEEGQSPTAAQLTSCSTTLNMLVKTWQAEGLNLFALQRLYLFLQKDTHEYTLSSTGDNFTASFVKTTTTATAASGTTTLSITAATGMSANDYIGVKLDDGTLQWTTISGTPTTTVTLATPLTADVSSGVVVYVYTSKANRPMKITNALRRDLTDNDIPMEMISRDEFVRLADKTTDGSVTQLYYDPQVSAGILHTWTETDTVDNYLVLWVQRTLEDFDAAGDDADFPQEWYLPLVFNLAMVMIPKYGAPSSIARQIMSFAGLYKSIAEGFDSEDGFMIVPDMS